MAQKNIIELNGKKYDALSGTLLGESRIKASSPPSVSSQRGRVIDGFVKNKSSHLSPALPKPQPVKPLLLEEEPLAQAVAKKFSGPSKLKKNLDVQRVASPKSALKPHQPERPKTLMRHVVKKPNTTMKPSMKTANPSEVMAAPKSTIAKPLEKKLSASNVNPFRLARSRHVSKSHHIRRFEQSKHSATAVAASAATNAAAPAANRPVHYATRPMRPDFRAAGPQVIVTKSAGQSAPVTAVQTQAVATQKASSTDVFEAALAHATSHEQKTPAHAKHRSSRHRRFVNIMAGIGAFLLIGGFAAYMNMASIELRVASMHAGFRAEMPHYQPTGYALDGSIESTNGKVAMNFRSGNSLYTVTQESSDWNSTTLLDQTAAERGQPAQTIQSKGRTIYIYDNSNATWVNGGVRYQVSGNAALNADDLVALATSM